MELLGVLLVDAGIAASFLGTVSLIKPLRFLGIRSRLHGAAVLGIGVASIVAGMSLPTSLRRAARREALIDDFIPAWQFAELHETRVQAPPERVWDAIQKVTAEEIWLFRTLTSIRSPGRSDISILNAPEKMPILEVATSTTFLTLAEEPNRELVVGTIVVAPGGRPRLSPAEFAALEQPGFAKAAMNFRIEDEGGGWSRVTTETRVYATDPKACRRFAAYWRVIYPGSSFIRVMWLRAIRNRATPVTGG